MIFTLNILLTGFNPLLPLLRATSSGSLMAPPTFGQYLKLFNVSATSWLPIPLILTSLFVGAQESIYILDWWLSPELYLRRPPSRNEQYRLDAMLQAAAERGVQVNVIVYKEVEAALTLDSAVCNSISRFSFCRLKCSPEANSQHL